MDISNLLFISENTDSKDLNRIRALKIVIAFFAILVQYFLFSMVPLFFFSSIFKIILLLITVSYIFLKLFLQFPLIFAFLFGFTVLDSVENWNATIAC